MVRKAEQPEQSTLSDSPLEAYLNELSRRFPLQDVPSPTTLVHSSYWPVPSTQECSAIEASLPSVQDGIVFLESELKTVQNFIQLRMCNYISYSEFQRSRMSPIRKLPNELLGHIFGYLLWRSVDAAGNDPSDVWNLMCVCARWRDVIQNTPSFWNDLGVEGTRKSNMPSLSAISERVRACLSNSGKADLTISVWYKQCPSYIVEEMANHCDRWKSFEARVDILDNVLQETDMGSKVQERGLSNLRVLILEGDDASIPCALDLFESASALEKLYLDTTSLHNIADFPWINLKVLSLISCEVDKDEIRFIMNATPVLEELIWSHDIDFEPDFVPIYHPSLRKLTVGENLDELGGVPMLTGPHLSDICLMGNITDYRAVIRGIRGAPSVTCLHFMWTSCAFILRVMKELDYIGELVVELDTQVLESFLAYIAEFSEAAEVLPSLRKLSIVCQSSNCVRISALEEFMHSRSSTVVDQKSTAAVSLSCVTLKFHDGGVNVADLDELKNVGTRLGIDVLIDN